MVEDGGAAVGNRGVDVHLHSGEGHEHDLLQVPVQLLDLERIRAQVLATQVLVHPVQTRGEPVHLPGGGAIVPDHIVRRPAFELVEVGPADRLRPKRVELVGAALRGGDHAKEQQRFHMDEPGQGRCGAHQAEDGRPEAGCLGGRPLAFGC